jgi:hypothetical protein
MTDREVEIEGSADTGGPFTVGDTLTIYDAARVYFGGHPGGIFIEEASIDQLERFLGREARDGVRTLGWDIYCELTRRVEAGTIKPVRAAFLPSGKVNPRDTFIMTEDVAALAKEREESPKYLAPWTIVRPTDLQEDAPSPEAKPGPGLARNPPMSDVALQEQLRPFLMSFKSDREATGARFNQVIARDAAENHFGKRIERSRFRTVYRNANLNQDGGRPRKTPPKS